MSPELGIEAKMPAEMGGGARRWERTVLLPAPPKGKMA